MVVIMEAKFFISILLLNLPHFILAQNIHYQQLHSLSILQKNHCAITNNFMTINDERSLYLFRITGIDKEDDINFYGLSLGLLHQNLNANFSGISLSMNLGDQTIPKSNISVNGINFSLFHTITSGTINGISISGIGSDAEVINGLELGIVGTDTDYLNGLTIGGFTSRSICINGVQLSFIINICCRLNGISISAINSQLKGFYDENTMSANGLVIGVLNAFNIHGLSVGAINIGNSWLQIGLLNIGNSIVQIGLVNLDENKKMGIPIINVNL